MRFTITIRSRFVRFPSERSNSQRNVGVRSPSDRTSRKVGGGTNLCGGQNSRWTASNASATPAARLQPSVRSASRWGWLLSWESLVSLLQPSLSKAMLMQRWYVICKSFATLIQIFNISPFYRLNTLIKLDVFMGIGGWYFFAPLEFHLMDFGHQIWDIAGRKNLKWN